jgi:hypothetical protein
VIKTRVMWLGYVACMKKMWNSFQSWIAVLHGRVRSAGLVLIERIILECIWEKSDVNVWIFLYFNIFRLIMKMYLPLVSLNLAVVSNEAYLLAVVIMLCDINSFLFL